MNSSQSNFIALVSGSIFINASKDVKEFIACQFALESNFGNSDLALRFSNYCGMKKVTSRITSQVSYSVTAQSFSDPINQFGMYDSLLDCIFDYCLWLSYNKANKSILFDLDLFKAFLIKHNYCPESDYINRISNLFNSYKNGKN